MYPTILVVDDEPAVLESIALVLAKCDYSVSKAQSGEEALALFQEKAFDLVLTDLKMQGMDGLQLATRLKEVNPQQLILLVTAFAPTQPGEQFCGVVLKPFSMRELRSQVAAALDTRSRPAAAAIA
jgi:two-component system, NtrC family, response regulator PilR